MEPAKARATSQAAQRGGHCALAPGELACRQKGTQVRQQRLFCIDESGFYPLPSVVRTYAPVGQAPILPEWWTRDHLSTISAISPEGTLYCHCQDQAIDSADVVAFLEHLLHGVPGPIVILWDGAPIHRTQLIQEFLANRAAQRSTWSGCRPIPPELNPGEGLWGHLKGVELRDETIFFNHLTAIRLPLSTRQASWRGTL